MPANIKQKAWVIRIDDPPERAPGPEFWAFVQSPGIFCCRELGGQPSEPNPHYHIACVFAEAISKQTLTNRLKSLLPNHTQCERAVSVWKDYGTPEDRLLQYLSKGQDKDTPPVIRFNNTLHDVKQLQQQYWIVNKDLVKKGKDMPLCQRVYEALKDQLKEINFDERANLIYDETMRQTQGRVNDNIAWPHIQWVMYRVDPQTVSMNFRERMAKKWGIEKFYS